MQCRPRILLLSAVLLSGLYACGPEPRRTVESIATSQTRIENLEDDPVLVRVDGTMIRQSDVEREILAQDGSATALMPEPGSEEFQDVLEQLVDQRLLALEARRRGLHQSDEARRRLALAEERILGNVLVETALSDAVTEETIREIYEQQIRLIPLGEEVRARHILVETLAEANSIRTLLEAGEDFAELAVRLSMDHATRLEGGDLGYFSEDGILPSFGSRAFTMAEGEISLPFQTEFGWHILMVTDRRRQPPPSLEALRPNIVRYYTFDQLEGLVSDLRGNAVIERADLSLLSDVPEAEQIEDDASASDPD